AISVVAVERTAGGRSAGPVAGLSGGEIRKARGCFDQQPAGSRFGNVGWSDGRFATECGRKSPGSTGCDPGAAASRAGKGRRVAGADRGTQGEGRQAWRGEI